MFPPRPLALAFCLGVLPLEVFWIIANVLLGVMLWDIHRGVNHIAAMAEDLHRKTDELLRRVPPTA